MSPKCKPRVVTHCLWCGNELHLPQYQIRESGNFCNRSCAAYYQHSQMGHGSFILRCPICGIEKEVKKSHRNIIKTCGKRECRSAHMHQHFKDNLAEQLGQPAKDALQQAYVIERQSYRQICATWEIGNHTLIDLMKEFGIEPRHGSEAIETQWENNDKRRKQHAKQASRWMKRYYANGGECPSKRPDVRCKISKAKRHDNWMRGRTGSKHHLWQGGKIWWRGKDWDDLKEEIRQRDSYRCQRCDMIDEQCIIEYGAPLQVHHIIPYRLSKDNSPKNLKTLCNKCHRFEDYQFLWLL